MKKKALGLCAAAMLMMFSPALNAGCSCDSATQRRCKMKSSSGDKCKGYGAGKVDIAPLIEPIG